MINKKNNKLFGRGFSLVEVLIGSSIICLSLIFIINLETGISKLGFNSVSRIQAGMLAEEGVAAIINLRNVSWQNIATLDNNVPYKLFWDQGDGLWKTAAWANLIDNKFDRTVVFYDVYRSPLTYEIVPPPNGWFLLTDIPVIDPGTKKFVVTITWHDDNGTSTKSVTSYVHNIFNK